MSLSKYLSVTRAGPRLLLSLLLFVPFALAADEAQQDQIEALKQQLRDLQERVERLESEVEQGVPVNMAPKVEPVPGGWRKEHNWKLLAEGMSDYEVKAILGEPDRQKTVKKFEFWYYGDSKLSVYMRRLKSWDIPSGFDSE
jgi:hypothetical protein